MSSPTTPLPDPVLVSIVVRSMDRPTLAQALSSVEAQTWPAIEVIVVNAKGGDHSPLHSRCGPFDLRLIQGGSPLGRAQAANAGLGAARGEWVCFLDDDDWFDSGHIAMLARRLAEVPSAVAAYSGVSCVEVEDGTGELREVMRYNLDFDAGRLLCENYLPIHSVLFSRRAAARTSGFDESLPIFEDWDFWIQLSRIGPFSHVDKVSATYRLGSGDSGLYGNTALQEEFARRILGKWLEVTRPEDWAAVWQLCRQGLRSEEMLRRELECVRRDLSREVRRLEGELVAMASEAQRRNQAAVEVRERLENALKGTMREYQSAAKLLRHEQYTVLRPIARNLKRTLQPVWQSLPRPLQTAARRALGRTVRLGDSVPATAVTPGTGSAQDWRQALAGGAAGAFTVVVFPVIDWHFRIQRPQHLARELGRQGHRVLYLSTTFGPGAAGCRLLESPSPNVHLLQLALSGPTPNIYEDLLSPDQTLELADALIWLQQAAGLGALVSLVNLPFWRPVAARLPGNLMVYDCMDYHAGFSTNTGVMLNEEEGLLRDCDLLLTTSTRLAQLMQAKAPGKPHALIRNGTEVEHFAQSPPLLAIQRDGRPVIGYFGAISEWFDMQLVVSAARERPGWRFVLIGSTAGCNISEARRVPNIEFVGEVPYADLPGWVHGFDACLIPFVLNELTSCTNPVKVYEYLSAGKPVVATRLPELEAIADQVYLASGSAELVRQLDRALDESADQEAVRARRAWASDHSWQARAQQLSAAIAACLPRVSVVVLCFNNLELTRACLDSIERHSLWPDLELVCVDNASSDDTPAYLRQFASSRPWVKLVLNDANLGFAAGNNAGLAAATGEVLVLLNNDTEVSPGWIQGLRRHFQRDARLGLVGPVTDNIGNEAKVEASYPEKMGMPAWAAARAVRFAGQRMDCRVLAFFCVALRRQVYQEVGGLDESFGLGFFEDDDYCNRARAAGWDLAIAEDVFVHHHLSASFDKMNNSTRQALFEKNREIYERKWGPWVPHQYRRAESGE